MLTDVKVMPAKDNETAGIRKIHHMRIQPIQFQPLPFKPLTIATHYFSNFLQFRPKLALANISINYIFDLSGFHFHTFLNSNVLLLRLFDSFLILV